VPQGNSCVAIKNKCHFFFTKSEQEDRKGPAWGVGVGTCGRKEEVRIMSTFLRR
jgi:hypothetical protein